QRPSRRRPHDLRRTRRAGARGRRVAAGLLPRPLRPPVRAHSVTFVPLSRPPVDDEIKRAVLAAIDSRQYVLGPQCRQLEVELASTTGVRHAVLTSSATAALWLALRALGVKAGDEILVPSHTAFPTVEAICFAEATPVFVDADEFYTLDVPDAEAKATPRTVGIVPVHLYGQPVDLTAVERLASRLGLWVLEDCAPGRDERAPARARAPLCARAGRPAARLARSARARPPRVPPLRGAHGSPCRAGEVPQGARDPDRDPLSGSDASSAAGRAPLASA